MPRGPATGSGGLSRSSLLLGQLPRQLHQRRPDMPVPPARVYPCGPWPLNAGPAMSRCAHGCRPRARAGTPPRRARHPARCCAAPRSATLSIGADLLAHLLGDRQRPQRLADPGAPAACTVLTSSSSLPRRSATRSPSATTQCPVSVATSTITSSSFSSVAFTGASGEHEPALGVGVEHLDGLAAVHVEHVAGPGRAARHHVLGHRRERGDRDERA